MAAKKNQAYYQMKQKLINCEYAPGTMLTEAQLAADFGLSRTPIREALSRLEVDGYIKILPKKGILVTDVSLFDVSQIFQTRLEIEPLIIRLAAPHLDVEKLLMFKNFFEADEKDILGTFRMDTAMHLYIIDNCRNQYLIDMMHKLFDDNTRIVIATKQNEVKIHHAKKEHLDILDSLIRHDDVDRTARMMRAHVETCQKAALDYFYSAGYNRSL